MLVASQNEHRFDLIPSHLLQIVDGVDRDRDRFAAICDCDEFLVATHGNGRDKARRMPEIRDLLIEYGAIEDDKSAGQVDQATLSLRNMVDGGGSRSQDIINIVAKFG